MELCCRDKREAFGSGKGNELEGGLHEGGEERRDCVEVWKIRVFGEVSDTETATPFVLVEELVAWNSDM